MRWPVMKGWIHGLWIAAIHSTLPSCVSSPACLPIHPYVPRLLFLAFRTCWPLLQQRQQRLTAGGECWLSEAPRMHGMHAHQPRRTASTLRIVSLQPTCCDSCPPAPQPQTLDSTPLHSPSAVPTARGSWVSGTPTIAETTPGRWATPCRQWIWVAATRPWTWAWAGATAAQCCSRTRRPGCECSSARGGWLGGAWAGGRAVGMQGAGSPEGRKGALGFAQALGRERGGLGLV
mgnify:CR=1 FL=1